MPAKPKSAVSGGTKENPWKLKTPPGTSEFEAYRDESLDTPALVVTVGKTVLHYHLRAIDDLHEMLRKYGDWMVLGSADEHKEAAPGTVEAWGRSSDNPVGGWYGLHIARLAHSIVNCGENKVLQHFPFVHIDDGRIDLDRG